MVNYILNSKAAWGSTGFDDKTVRNLADYSVDVNTCELKATLVLEVVDIYFGYFYTLINHSAQKVSRTNIQVPWDQAQQPITGVRRCHGVCFRCNQDPWRKTYLWPNRV
jgi:hypothetical protein